MKNNLNRKKGFEDDLDRELKKAELFLNKTNDDVIGKNDLSYIRTEQSNSNSNKFISDKDLNSTLSNNQNNESKLFTFAENDQTNNNGGLKTININLKDDDLLLKYKKQLKSFGFPEIGKMLFENDTEKEKTLKFFDFIMSKKTIESETRISYKKQVI